METDYMINEKYAKKFCCEDLSLIENYDIAVADTTQTWDCHHRQGTIYTRDDLKKIGEYYNRPAIELIFLTSSEHHSLHNKGKKFTEDHKRKIGDAQKGILKGPMREEHKKAIGKALINSPKKSKTVLQFTKSGEFISEWPSMNEAERELGIAHSSICSCCNGTRKSAGGYVWEYA